MVEDQLIIDLFFERQESALEKSQEKYGKRLYKTANNILKNAGDSQECVNDTLLKAWETIPPSRPNLLGAFLTRITRNLAINKWNAQRAQKRGGGETDLLLGELQDCIAEPTDIHQSYESQHIVQTINNYLETISQKDRILFVLRYFNHEPLESISRRLNISEGSVKSKLFRIRKKLGKYLEKEGITL